MQMIPSLTQALTLIISPLGTSLLAGIAGLLLYRMNSQAKARFLGMLLQFFSIAWLWLWSMPVVAFALVAYLEAAYPAQSLEKIPKADAIVILGGAIAPPMPPKYPYPNLNNRADRIWQGARLYHAGKAPMVVLSGGFDPEISAFSEADAMASFLKDLGVPSDALRLEGQSITTAQNAQYVAQILQPNIEKNMGGIKHILLVTSAIHMHRAKALFEDQNFIVEPIAIDHEAVFKPTGIKAWIPEADALAASSKAIKEWLGRLVY